MGRAWLWGIGLLGVAALAWMLFLDGGVKEPGDPYGLFGGGPGTAGTEGNSTPQLKGRDGAPLARERGPGEMGGIQGTVLDTKGRPAAGVTVSAAPLPPTPQWEQYRRGATKLFDPPELPGPEVARAVSAADGTFTLEGLEAHERYVVRALAAPPRYGTAVEWTAVPGRARNLVLLVGEGSPFRGRVVDAAGAGAQAWVKVWVRENAGAAPWLSATWNLPTFRTHADGRFDLGSVPDGTLAFHVTVPGRGQRTSIEVDTPADGEVEIRFEDPGGGTLEGTVRDTAGGPVAGAQIAVTTRLDRTGSILSTTTRAARSSTDGSFRAERLQPGLVQSVYVYAHGYVAPPPLGAGLPIGEGKVARLDIVLARGAVIAGRVTDPEGIPIPGADLRASQQPTGYGRWAQAVAQATAGSDGRYELRDVPLGPGNVSAAAEGYYQPTDDAVTPSGPWAARLCAPYEAREEGERIELDVVLRAATPVEGQVVDAAGQPVAGADVQAVQASGTSYYAGGRRRGSAVATTAADGSFRLPGFPPDTSHKLTARTATHLSDTVRVTIPHDGPARPVTLTVKEGAAVSGRVLRADGTPVAGIGVTCSAAAASVHTDVEGAFAFTGLREGSHSVQARGGSDRGGAERKVDLVAGKRLEGIELVLPKTGSISGVVVDEEDLPMAGIQVRARAVSASGSGSRGRRTSRYARTDQKGEFEIEDLPEGDYGLTAGGRGQEETQSVGAAGVRLVYKEYERRAVEGRVLDPEGRPVATGQIRVWYGSGSNRSNPRRTSSSRATISAGYFRTQLGTSVETVDLEVTAARDATGRRINFLPGRSNDHDLEAGPFELRLQVGLELRGRVVDTQGTGLASVLVGVRKKGQNSSYYGYWPGQGGDLGFTQDDGSFCFLGLEDGEMSVTASLGGDWLTPEPVDTRPGAAEVVIRVGKGAVIEGTVRDEEGVLLPAIPVSLGETQDSRKARGVSTRPGNPMDRFRLSTYTGADGRFRVRGLPPDASYHVTASGGGSAEGFVSETIQDVVAGTRDVGLVLRAGAFLEGDVVGPDGEPVTNVSVQASPLDTRSGRSGASAHLGGGTSTFRLGPLVPGRYQVTVRIHRGNYASPAPLEASAPASDVRIALSNALTVVGRLEGTDVSGFTVLYGVKGNSTSVRVGADGSFALKNVKGAEGTLLAHKSGDDRYALLEPVRAGQGPYVLVLQRGMCITGYVEGLPAGHKGGSVYAFFQGLWLQGTLFPDGRFAILGLPPGTCRIQGWVPGGQLSAADNVESGSTGIVLTFTPSKSTR